MRIRCNCFPGGRHKALTASYDDGSIHDRRLVQIFNAHGVRGAFHLNSGFLDMEGHVGAKEVAALYAGHEVSAHTAHHPPLADGSPTLIAAEILNDRRALEALVGYPVRGMRYPNGSFDDRVIAMLPTLGIEYARTVISTGAFDLPRDFLAWTATCHHEGRLLALAEKFTAPARHDPLQLFYVWGHSYEFDRQKNWDLIEGFCRLVGGRPEIWYATNIEVLDYVNAMRGLRFSAAADMVYNPAGQSVWITVDGQTCEIPAGRTVRL